MLESKRVFKPKSLIRYLRANGGKSPSKIMILLIAVRSSIRTTLASFLEHEGLPTKSCETIADGLSACEKGLEFDLILVDHRLSDGSAHDCMAEFARRRFDVPMIVIGAPLKAEAELYRDGALAVLGAGFSPRSAVLQCVNLRVLIRRKVFPKSKVALKPASEFSFGEVSVSPEERLLRPKRGPRKRRPAVPLSRLQIRLLQALQAAPGRILDYEFIFHTVWRKAYRGNNAAIREAVSSLRKRFRRAGFQFNRWVATVHGEGYRYDRA